VFTQQSLQPKLLCRRYAGVLYALQNTVTAEQNSTRHLRHCVCHLIV